MTHLLDSPRGNTSGRMETAGVKLPAMTQRLFPVGDGDMGPADQAGQDREFQIPDRLALTPPVRWDRSMSWTWPH